MNDVFNRSDPVGKRRAVAFEDQSVCSRQAVVAVLLDQIDDPHRVDRRIGVELQRDLFGVGVEFADSERFAEQPQPVAVEQSPRLWR
jgi:hypothetical protein